MSWASPALFSLVASFHVAQAKLYSFNCSSPEYLSPHKKRKNRVNPVSRASPAHMNSPQEENFVSATMFPVSGKQINIDRKHNVSQFAQGLTSKIHFLALQEYLDFVFAGDYLQ